MTKVILVIIFSVYFGGLILIGFIAFSNDPAGIVAPWYIIFWATYWGPIAAVVTGLIYSLWYRTYKRGQPALYFSGFIDEEGKRAPITIKISKPKRIKETGDWRCEVFAPLLFYGTEKIVGVDKAQARKLAVEFLRSIIGKRCLYNHEGEIISLERLELAA